MKTNKDSKRSVANVNEHTPTPWHLDENLFIMSDKEGRSIHSVIDDVAISKNDAEFIVRAVNNHEALLQSLKYEHDQIHDSEVQDETNLKCVTCNAIWNAQAEGGK